MSVARKNARAMPSFSRARRATPATIRARTRAEVQAKRLGIALKEARRRSGLTQQDLADRVAVSQAQVSRLERGFGHTASIETWACVGAAVGCDLAAYLEQASGADLPRDYEHLKRQQLVLTTASPGGWRAGPETPVDPTWTRSRSVDVLLERPATREAVVVEIWDYFDDVGAAWRGLDAKIRAVQRMRAGWPVGGLIVVRGTRRNRSLVREFAPLFRTRYRGSSVVWLHALETRAPVPEAPGFLWTDIRGTRLIPARFDL